MHTHLSALHSRHRFASMGALRTALAVLISIYPVVVMDVLAAGDAPSDVVGANEIKNQLESRKRRGAKPADERSTQSIERLNALRKQRGLNLQERDELADAIETLPRIDLTVYFAFDSAEIDGRAVPQLDELGRALQDLKGRTSGIYIIGHTDAKGDEDYNWHLSLRRAEAVVSFLISKYAIPRDLLTSEGFGERRLRDRQAPYSAANRRVEIVNLPKP